MLNISHENMLLLYLFFLMFGLCSCLVHLALRRILPPPLKKKKETKKKLEFEIENLFTRVLMLDAIIQVRKGLFTLGISECFSQRLLSKDWREVMKLSQPMLLW